ncbi:MAG: gephyrin-like molybdotransferase Glp [Cyanobacteria bacterium J06635_15]
MLPALDAESLILNLVHPLNPIQDCESVELSQALGRILAADVTSDLDFPHWDNSAMDGYAVRFSDVQGASSEAPVWLKVVEDIPAGKRPQRSLQAGQAARILTGSMVPSGADTIVIQENTERQGDQVKILSQPDDQAFVRHKASYYQAGEPLLRLGTVLNGPEIAILAAAQCPQVKVYRRLRVAILSTGDELVEPNQPLAPGQIVDSNQYALAALVTQAGATPISLGIVPDDPTILKAKIAAAVAQADVVLSSGGVSVGDYDYVDRILNELQATLHIRAVAVKPGKPLTVATVPQAAPVLYFGLPGNPVSALVSFWRFVEPALRKRSGLGHGWSPVFVRARSRHDLKSGGRRETYLWGQLHLTAVGYEFAIAGGGHSSGNLVNLGTTNALAVVPIGTRKISAGETVQVMVTGRPVTR